MTIDRSQCALPPAFSLSRSEADGCAKQLAQLPDLPWELLRSLRRHLDEIEESPAERDAGAYLVERYGKDSIFKGAILQLTSSNNDLCLFTDNELIAAVGYSYGGPDWNAALRGDPNAELDHARLAGITSLMSKVLKKLPKFPDNYVFRGMNESIALKDEFQPGKKLQLLGFTSTTQDPLVMTNFGGACMLIQTTSGKDIKYFSAMPVESEILIDAGHEFFIKANKPFDSSSVDEIRAKKCAGYTDLSGLDWFAAQRCPDPASYIGCKRFLELQEIAD